MITLASLAAHLLDGLDTLTLARAVHRMARQIDSLTALAASEGDRADVAEAAAEEYRRLYESEVDARGRAEQEYCLVQIDRDVLVKQRDELSAALSRSRAAEEQARWDAVGENRKRRDMQAERDELRAKVAQLEVEKANVARAWNAADDERTELRERLTRLQSGRAAGITPALSTAQIGERLHLQWEAKNAHGGDPVDAPPPSQPRNDRTARLVRHAARLADVARRMVRFDVENDGIRFETLREWLADERATDCNLERSAAE